MTKPRARDLGLDFPGELGPKNALTDIPGAPGGHTTLIDDATTGYGRGPVRTGVTTILPRGHAVMPKPVWAGQFNLNGKLLDPLYLAAVKAVEEAVVNALVAAEAMTTIKPRGLVCRAIDHDELRAILRRYGRLRPDAH